MEKIQLKTRDASEIVSVADIVRIEAEGNYSIVYMLAKSVRISKQLGYFEEQLGNYDFIRVHNSHLVNLKRIKSVKPGKTLQLELDDGSFVSVSESYRRKLEQKLSEEFKKI